MLHPRETICTERLKGERYLVPQWKADSLWPKRGRDTLPFRAGQALGLKGGRNTLPLQQRPGSLSPATGRNTLLGLSATSANRTKGGEIPCWRCCAIVSSWLPDTSAITGAAKQYAFLSFSLFLFVSHKRLYGKAYFYNAGEGNLAPWGGKPCQPGRDTLPKRGEMPWQRGKGYGASTTMRYSAG